MDKIKPAIASSLALLLGIGYVNAAAAAPSAKWQLDNQTEESYQGGGAVVFSQVMEQKDKCLAQPTQVLKLP